MERTRGTCKTPPSSPTWGNKGEKTERKGAKKKKTVEDVMTKNF